MGRFGTDAVALATIAGAAVVGGIGTAAVLGANANHGHQHEDRFEYEVTDSRHGRQIEIRTGVVNKAVIIAQGRRGDREMRRRRHRHPDRMNEARSRLNEARFERLRFSNEFNSSLEHRIQAELAEAQAAVEAEMAQIEFAVEVLEIEVEAKVNR
jgi:hypothetical protein